LAIIEPQHFSDGSMHLLSIDRLGLSWATFLTWAFRQLASWRFLDFGFLYRLREFRVYHYVCATVSPEENNIIAHLVFCTEPVMR
jgi:hypothetical protein